jgi:hypothetical protein
MVLFDKVLKSVLTHLKGYLQKQLISPVVVKVFVCSSFGIMVYYPTGGIWTYGLFAAFALYYVRNAVAPGLIPCQKSYSN